MSKPVHHFRFYRQGKDRGRILAAEWQSTMLLVYTWKYISLFSLIASYNFEFQFLKIGPCQLVPKLTLYRVPTFTLWNVPKYLLRNRPLLGILRPCQYSRLTCTAHKGRKFTNIWQIKSKMEPDPVQLVLYSVLYLFSILCVPFCIVWVPITM